jgi:hypothetical protein
LKGFVQTPLIGGNKETTMGPQVVGHCCAKERRGQNLCLGGEEHHELDSTRRRSRWFLAWKFGLGCGPFRIGPAISGCPWPVQEWTRHGNMTTTTLASQSWECWDWSGRPGTTAFHW